MASLPFSLASGTRETPVDYMSRLAFRNGRDSLRAVCSDFGVKVGALVRGDPDAVGKVALLGGAAPDALKREALRVLPTGRVAYRGCEFHAAILVRNRLRLCPACVEADRSAGSGRLEARAWRRGEWLLRDVRTCCDHRVGLVDLGETRDPRAPDFSRALARVATVPAGDRSSLTVPDALEGYILRRLGIYDGEATALPCLDPMPLHACVRLAEVMGAVALDGPRAPMTGISDERLHERQRVGFGLASRGADGVGHLVDRALVAAGRSGGQRGPQAILGRLYLWLADPVTDPSLDPFRDAVRKACLDRLPLGPGSAIVPFGMQVTERRLHSIRSASVETGIHQATLRTILVAAGVVQDDPSLADDLTTFDAVTHADLMRDLSEALDMDGAACQLGVSPGTLSKLVQAGLVVPLLGGVRSSFRHYRFRPADLEAFVVRLSPGNDPSRELRPGMRPLPSAASKAACPLATAVEFILSGRLRFVGHDPGGSGLASVLVCPRELRANVATLTSSGMVHPKEVREAMGLALHVVRALVRCGLLEGIRCRHPATGIPRLMVTRDSYVRFRLDHVTLVELAHAASISVARTWKTMSAAGVPVAVDHKLVGAVVYRRVDLAGSPLGHLAVAGPVLLD